MAVPRPARPFILHSGGVHSCKSCVGHTASMVEVKWSFLLSSLGSAEGGMKEGTAKLKSDVTLNPGENSLPKFVNHLLLSQQHCSTFFSLHIRNSHSCRAGDLHSCCSSLYTSQTVCSSDPMRSLKLGNVWVFVQLIFCPQWPMNQLKKNTNIA